MSYQSHNFQLVFYFSSTLKTFHTGVVTSPNHPGNYPDSCGSTATIQVEEGLVILLQFTAFKTEGSNDKLRITDGDGTTLLGKACGSSLPANIKSTSNVIEMFFKTDASKTKEGWSAGWTAVTPGEQTNSLELAVLCLWFTKE